MRLRPASAALGLAALLLVGTATPAASQSLGSASLSGTARAAFRGLPGVLVTLSSLDGAGAHELTTDGSGNFAFPLVAPGDYEVRVEAVGYRPILARGLLLAGGDRVDLDFDLVLAPPPVLTVDTVSVAAATQRRWDAAGVRVAARDLSELPFRFDDLLEVSALSPGYDGALGVGGLPGSLTRVVADGVPVPSAPMTTSGAEALAHPAFPRTAVQALTARSASTDVEWGGSAAGYLPLSTRSSTRGQGLELEGAWSGGPLWSSSQIDASSPSLTSFQGSAAAGVPIGANRSRLFVLGEAFRQETPLAPRLDEATATTLFGLDPDLLGTLIEPSRERISRYSGLVRFDAQPSTASRFFLRGAMGLATREHEGPGAVAPAPYLSLAEESLQYSVAASLTRSSGSGLLLELHAGLSGSRREWGGEDALAPAFLTGPGASLGSVTGEVGESSRTDAFLIPVLHYPFAGGTLKGGASARMSWHALESGRVQETFFSDGAALLAAQGFQSVVGAPAADFSTSEYEAFAQFAFEARPGLEATVGGRLGVELIPADGADTNSAWFLQTGLRNDVYPTRLTQAGARASVSWEPSPGGSTLLTTTIALDHGDLDTRALAELFTHDVTAVSARQAGTGVTWPTPTTPPVGTALPSLTLIGPESRAPRSLHAGASVVQRLAPGWSLHAGLAFRRTDFFLRRRNLNLPVVPLASDAFGRGVFGTLSQDGTLVSATDDDGRRFAAFQEVWALDSDGWSESRAATAGLEYSSDVASLYAAYTRSRTEDNWLGAAGPYQDLSLSPQLPDGDDWSQGTSDFDVPNRLVVAGSATVSRATLSVVYRLRSGAPFTPGYRAGVDANGDGSARNDVAFVDPALPTDLTDAWDCLADQSGAFAERNSCRGPAVHGLDVRLAVTLGRVMGREARLVLDAFNLVESELGVVDHALYLVDSSGSITTSPDGSTVTVPVIPNPDFGALLNTTGRGRMLRVGIRIG